MSAAKFLNYLETIRKNDDGGSSIYNRAWLLNQVMEQVTEGKLKHNDLTFPENSEWHFLPPLPSFFYDKKKESEMFSQGTRSAIGNIQLNKSLDFIEVKQDCSCLYFIETPKYKNVNLTYLKQTVANLLKMVYMGMNEGKITKIPNKIGVYILIPKGAEIKGTKDELKEAIRKYLNSFLNGNYPFQKISTIRKEEIDWAMDNFETFMDKLDVKLITWEELIASMENTETRTEINEFYNTCKDSTYELH